MPGSAYNPSFEKTFLSTNDLRTKQFFGVALDPSNDNSIILANAQTNKCIGILLNAPNAGDTAHVALFGRTLRVQAGAAVTKGASVTPNASGKFITTTTAGNQESGIALETVTADGDFMEIMTVGGRVPA